MGPQEDTFILTSRSKNAKSGCSKWAVFGRSQGPQLAENLLSDALRPLSWRTCEAELEKQGLAAFGLFWSHEGVSLETQAGEKETIAS